MIIHSCIFINRAVFQIKREHGLPVFDVDNLTVHLLHHYWGLVIEPVSGKDSRLFIYIC